MADMKTVQMVMDFTTDHAHGVVKYYLEMNEEWWYKDLTDHLITSFETRETFSSLVSNFTAGV